MQTVRPQIVHAIEVPLWRAPYTDDALSVLLSDSADLTATASWSWRRPLKVKFTVTSPPLVMEQETGDVQPLGC
jgi:hypothetical protein